MAITRIQHIYEAYKDDVKFTDSLYFDLDEWEQLDEVALNSIKAQRFQSHLERVNNAKNNLSPNAALSAEEKAAREAHLESLVRASLNSL